MKSPRILPLLAIHLIACGSLKAAEPVDSTFPSAVVPVLKARCVNCHSGDKPKSDLDLSTLAPDFARNGDVWKEVMDRLVEGSMPPKAKPRLLPDEQKAVVEWVATSLSAYQTKLAAEQGRTRLRRINRTEYVNTMHDLLGVEIDPETLPEDGVAAGFDNVDAALDLSASLLERYLETADAALGEALAKDPPRPSETQRVDLVALASQKVNSKKGRRFGESTVVDKGQVIFFSDSPGGQGIHEAKVPVAGIYRCRLSASAYRHGPSMTVLLYAGKYGFPFLTTRLVGAKDVADKPTIIEFTTHMGAMESFRIVGQGLAMLHNKLPKDYDGPGLAVQSMEIVGPIVESWPPPKTARLLGGVDLSKGTFADAQAILRRFAPRAFRRAVTESELAPYFGLVKSRLDKGYAFDAALEVGLKGILCSPDFLYLAASPGKLSDYDLASRLSYFLWSSTPDDVLLARAERNELSKPEVLHAEVERMLADAKSYAFTENFTGQWLKLRDLKATLPEKKVYPEFDDLLELSMPQETHRFFEEILKNDRNLLEFVSSDWTMLNERLAEHYGIPGIIGTEFRKVQLPANSRRGGVLTQAAVLKVTANGTNTSPVIRGAFVLDRILGTPAKPPPKNVPALEPDIRGAKTIREQLAKHRQIEMCASCHTKIDPPGNALENYDVIGGWREHYRIKPEDGKHEKIRASHGREAPVGIGPNVQAADVLPDGESFTDIDSFKKIVLKNPDQFARCLTEKLLTYGTGHKQEFADHRAVEKILADIRSKNYGFRTLIHDIVDSPTFLNK